MSRARIARRWPPSRRARARPWTATPWPICRCLCWWSPASATTWPARRNRWREVFPLGKGVSLPGVDHFSAIPHASLKATVFDFIDGVLDDDFPPFE